MAHTPPPFFNTGPTPLARLLLFAVLALALLITDARWRYLDDLRQGVAVVIYPLQRLAAAPAALIQHAQEFFVTHARLRADNARLTEDNLSHAAAAQKNLALAADNASLRQLLAARERRSEKLLTADVLYAARDPFSQRIVIDKGTQHEIQNGLPVIDATGVVGQVTRTYPMLSEVTLITDRGHLIPVLNVRSGLRSVLTGTGAHGVLELQFAPLNADVQKGDQFVTSGIDGIYPAGLPVAQVLTVERNPSATFSRVTCQPQGGVTRHTRVFVVQGPATALPPRPAEDSGPAARARKGRK